MRITLLLACWLVHPLLLLAQKPDWERLMPQIYAPLEKEIADTIAARRAEAAAVRAAMEQIVTEKKLDRAFIFGDGDKHLQEGMHQYFKSEPGNMLVDLERDARIVRLENLHVALYHSDVTLYRWLTHQKKLVGLRGKHNHFAWEGHYQKLSPEQRQGLDQEQRWAKWATNELVCLLTDNAADLIVSRPQRDLVRPLGLKFALLNDTTSYAGLQGMPLPFPPDKIPASFPLNGQYAFFPEESIPGVGYVVLPRGATGLLHERLQGTPILKARWTSSTGTRMYTDAKLENLEPVIYFNLPTGFFQPAQLYRLEVVALPERAFHIAADNDICWTRFRGTVAKAGDSGAAVKGEVKIAEMYFRTSRYTLREKLKTMNPVTNWETGMVVFTMDEPLDQLERRGGRHFEPLVSFNFVGSIASKLEQNLQDPALRYYLSVPTIEPLGGMPLDQLAVAERDNTLDAPFVRNTALVAKPEGYVRHLEARAGSGRIGNGYVLPVLGMGRDSIVVTTQVPVVERTHFERGKVPDVGPAVPCTLYIAQLVRIAQALELQRAQIRAQMEARAKFFYELEKRRSARTGVQMPGDLDYFRQQEAAHLPASAKFILEADLKKMFEDTPNKQLLYRRLFPGSTQNTATLPIE